MGLARGACLLERRTVGIGHHEDFAREGALCDDGDESIVPEAHCLNPVFGAHERKISALRRIVKNPRAPVSLPPMRWGMMLALGLIMALLHRVTAGGPLEARATLALGFLLLAAHLGGELARRARLPRLTGYLLVGFAVGPAWLGLVRREEVEALGLIEDAAMALIAFAAGAELTLDRLRQGRVALARLATGAVVFPFLAVTLVLLSVRP